MSEFEVLLVPLSLVLGLGITTILSGLIRIVKYRNEIEIHFLPVTWSFVILTYLVGHFNVLYDIETIGRAWSWGTFVTPLLQAMLLYVSAGLVLPAEIRKASSNMLTEFEENGRWALGALGALLATAPITNWIQTPGEFTSHRIASEVLNLSLAGLILVFFIWRKPSVQWSATVVFALLTLVGWAMFWAAPGRT